MRLYIKIKSFGLNIIEAQENIKYGNNIANGIYCCGPTKMRKRVTKFSYINFFFVILFN